jgi:signal transduction histidine kinase
MRNFRAAFQQSGRIRELHQIVRGEVYRIGYEAIQNACVHSGADRITVGLEYGPNLVLRILDNGRGIDEDVSRSGKAGHFGILGMHERATQIGAKLSIHNASEAGAEVVLVVPGKIIFADAAGRKMTRLSKWLRLFRVGQINP